MALLLLIFLFLLVTQAICLLDNSSSSNISLGSSLTADTNPSWLSPSGFFAFGFYRQDDGFAVGIWLASKPEITVVWTANRDDPPVSSNSTIQLTVDGRLLLHTAKGETKSIITNHSATSASMFDSGNFALYNHSDVVWESFAFPCDTMLGGQELSTAGTLVSSFSASQHSSGHFVLRMQYDGNLVAYPRNSPQEPDDAYWATGTFNIGYNSLNLNVTGSLNVVNARGVQRVLNPSITSRSRKNETLIFRATLEPDGNFVLYSHRFTTPSSGMMTEWAALQDPCKANGICGVNSYCSNTAGNAECHCFPGFLSINKTGNGKFLGCYRNFTDEEACSGIGPKLLYSITAMENIILSPIFDYSVMNLSKEACRKSCLDDCNCWASHYANFSCQMLKVPIIYALLNKSISATVFIKTSFPDDQDSGTRGPPTALTKQEQSAEADRKKLVSILAITLGALALVCTLIASSTFFFYRVHAGRYQRISQDVDFGLFRDHYALRSFSFDELQKATDGFKEVIGRNSYGEIYKGFILEGKKAVAVKRMDILSEGEHRWLRAELNVIAQTHHRNLVRLVGFSIKGARNLLVYEFMSNGSLADLLSNYNVERLPSSEECLKVALDVARGILYLHQECDARIIHCNITPHSILFDESWTAKITDFGLSKLLRPNQSGILTGVRGTGTGTGTGGYLAPEWHKNTLITTKVDIYSFGVVLLEILCCRSNVGIDEKMPLCTWVYNCFIAKELSRLIGDEDGDEVDVYMLEKMVKVGLLCIQDDPDARPPIKNVILMLEGTTDIPMPSSPSLSNLA